MASSTSDTAPPIDPPTTEEPVAQTPAKPEETTAKPDEATAKPEETTAKPEETTAKPEETTAKPEETAAKPEETAVDPAVDPLQIPLPQEFTASELIAKRREEKGPFFACCFAFCCCYLCYEKLEFVLDFVCCKTCK